MGAIIVLDEPRWDDFSRIEQVGGRRIQRGVCGSDSDVRLLASVGQRRRFGLASFASKVFDMIGSADTVIVTLSEHRTR
jgi:hypothetical protein